MLSTLAEYLGDELRTARRVHQARNQATASSAMRAGRSSGSQ
jgi:hypothetical protein